MSNADGRAAVAVPARGLPWLTESTPQAWDSYTSEDGPDYLIADELQSGLLLSIAVFTFW